MRALHLVWLSVWSVVSISAAARAEAPAPAPAPAADRVVAQKLLCEQIWLVTSSSSAPTKHLSLSDRALEGGGADVFVDGDMVRIEGQLLGEARREHFDYRFDHGVLVCARETHTSLHTVAAATVPAFWREDRLVFDGGKMVHAISDEAPAAGGAYHRTPAETAAAAKELLTLATASASGAPAAGTVVVGALDKEVIRGVVSAHTARVRGCYEKELAKTPALAGNVKVRFVISAAGSVTSAELTDDQLHNANVAKCLVDEIKSWVFPKPKGNGIVTVTYPFVFNAR